ncbi:MAG: WD40/YVTN/BNR-like repeat-containing protein, partial [Paracoccaceae bacterium]
LVLGTSKGAFVLTGDPDRKDWQVAGPHCGGWSINHVIGDAVSGTLWAGGGGEWPGAGVWRSQDGGATWQLSLLSNGSIDDMLRNSPEMAEYTGLSPSPDAPFKGEVSAVWSLALSGGALYAGAKPGKLYRSADGGVTWDNVAGINSHPEREGWSPGGAGLVLHSIVTDPANPAKLWIAISAAGVFATEDGGETWTARNRLSNADHAHAHPGGHEGHDTGLCVHNIVRAQGASDLMYQQNHHGVFRSPDGGRSWEDISAGLPSTFGFPVAVDPADPATLWVLPLNGDMQGRFPPGAAAAVWGSRDGGQTWTAGRQGLPQQNCYFTVLRQAMAVDRATPAGIYFGTNTGSVFASLDGGTEWHEIARHLPTILSVETLTKAT